MCYLTQDDRFFGTTQQGDEDTWSVDDSVPPPEFFDPAFDEWYDSLDEHEVRRYERGYNDGYEGFGTPCDPYDRLYVRGFWDGVDDAYGY